MLYYKGNDTNYLITVTCVGACVCMHVCVMISVFMHVTSDMCMCVQLCVFVCMFSCVCFCVYEAWAWPLLSPTNFWQTCITMNNAMINCNLCVLSRNVYSTSIMLFSYLMNLNCWKRGWIVMQKLHRCGCSITSIVIYSYKVIYTPCRPVYSVYLIVSGQFTVCC